MSEKLKLHYSGFWDFPLAFLVRWEGSLYLFFREFDDDQDEYEDHYRVYLMPFWPDEEIEACWGRIETKATRYLGKVAVRDVTFDPTHRQEIDAGIFQMLVALPEPVGVL